MIGFFVTGTDTDAGKTHIAQALLLAARARGMRAIGYKPIESGCPLGEPGPDALALASAANTKPQTTYTLHDPVAPHVAAQRQGQQLSLQPIVEQVQQYRETVDFLVVEGAGGFLVPMSLHESMADLARATKLPLLIVAPNRLGTINHSLLTIEAARQRNLQVAAVILNDLKLNTTMLDNSKSIEEHGSVLVLEFPHTNSPQQLVEYGEKLLLSLLR